MMTDDDDDGDDDDDDGDDDDGDGDRDAVSDGHRQIICHPAGRATATGKKCRGPGRDPQNWSCWDAFHDIEGDVSCLWSHRQPTSWFNSTF